MLAQSISLFHRGTHLEDFLNGQFGSGLKAFNSTEVDTSGNVSPDAYQPEFNPDEIRTTLTTQSLTLEVVVHPSLSQAGGPEVKVLI